MLRKLIKGDDQRRSRLHTRSGDRLSAGEVSSSIPPLVRRLLGRPPATGPWIAPSAIPPLDLWLRTGPRDCLELGSGASTVWLAERARSLVSLEDSEEWGRKVRTDLSDLDHAHAQVRVGGMDTLLREVLADGDATFDMVLIDQNEHSLSRPDAVELVRDRVVPGGLIVLDDSDRPEYAGTSQTLSGWGLVHYRGIRARPMTPTQTTAFIRPM